MNTRTTLSAFGMAMALAVAQATAQSYPVKPVQILVSSAPGAGSDLIARTVQELSRLQPGLPTLAEQGIPQVEQQGYFSLLAPQSTPTAIVARLNGEMNKVLATPQIREDLARRAVSTAGGTPEQLTDKFRREIDRWTAVVKRAGVKAEE